MNNERGSVLVVTLGFVLVFTTLGLGSMYLSTVQNEAAEKRESSNKAFWLAEAGIQKTLWKLKNNSISGFYQYDANVGGPCTTTTACVSFTNCGSKEKCFASPTNDPLSTYGDYDIVMDNLNSSVTATGSYPNRTVSNTTKRKIMLDSNSDYKYAFYAKDNIGTNSTNGIDNNACTDGYKWATPLTSPGTCGGGNSTNTGRIGTLGTAGTVVQLNNGVHIYGSVSTGPGGTVSNSGTIHVLPITNTNTGTLPSVSVALEEPTLASMSPTGGTISANLTLGTSGASCSVTLPCANSGTCNSGICYYKYTNINFSTPNKILTFQGPIRLFLTGTHPGFNDNNSVSVSSNFTFSFNAGASVKMYVTGKVSLTNNGEVNSQNDKKPKNFEIRSAYNFTNGGVAVANGGSFYGTVYAPDTDLTVGKNGGGTIFFGAMVGRTIHVNNNTPQHFENGLAGSILDSTRKWQEL